jgi:predicted dehydrogenase
VTGATVRVGVIGTGFGARVMAPVYSATKGCEVVDVVTPRDADATRALCQRPDVDLVSVHSPPVLHPTHVGWALHAGKAVLCDKPFGRSTDEAKLMAEQAAEAGAIHAVNFEFRHEPARVRIRDAIVGGAIGSVEYVHWTHFHAGSRRPLMAHGWLFEREPGGGWVRAFGSHAVDSLRWLFGDVESVTGTLRTAIPVRPMNGRDVTGDAEDGFLATFALASGISAVLDTTFAAPVTLPGRIIVMGSDGAIVNDGDRHVSLVGTDGREEMLFDPLPSSDPLCAMRAWVAALCEAVRAGRPISPSFEDGLACSRVMDALQPPPWA